MRINQTLLKVICLFAMTLNHIAHVFSVEGPLGFIFLFVGMAAMPIYCFLITEGFHYTRDRKKYLYRLIIFAVVSHFPYSWAFGAPFPFTSVMYTLSLGLIALMIIESERLQAIDKTVFCIALGFFSVIGDWPVVGILWIMLFYLYRDSRKTMWIHFLIISTLQAFYFSPVGSIEYYRFGFILAVPLIMAYNGEKGSVPRWMKWVFYAYYPLHLIALKTLSFIF